LKQSAIERMQVPLPALSEQKRIAAMLNQQMEQVIRVEEHIQHQCVRSSEIVASVLDSVFESPEISNWRTKRIEDIAETTSGSTPARGNSAYFNGGTIPWVKTGELKDGLITETEERITDLALQDCSLQVLPSGTLLVAMYGQGQTRGRTGLLGISATTNQACFAILPEPSVFESRFLQYWFRYSYRRLRLETEGRGGNQPNLNGLILRSLEVPLPDLAAQREIANCLDQKLALAGNINAKCSEANVAVRALPAALLRRAFAGEL